MSVKDMIKKSVLESGVFDQYNISSILVALVAALALGILIFLVYRRFYTGVIYSRTFAVTLVGMTVLTCMVTLAISTNVVISLGMVGALSIVRFRTAVKDPMDLLYLFWAITTGITAGAGMYVLALLAAAIMIFMIILFYSRQQRGKIYIAVIHYSGDEAGDEVIRCFGKRKYFIKSKTMRKEKTEMAEKSLGLCKGSITSYDVTPLFRFRRFIHHFNTGVTTLKAFKKCDLFIDLTAGDSFTDIYGQYTFDSETNVKLLVKKLDKPLILGPQTYGPFNNEKNINKAIKAINSADLVLSRDEKSADYIRKYTDKKVETTTDLAFELPYVRNNIQSDGIKVGLNISGLLISEKTEKTEFELKLKVNYDEYIKAVIDWLLESKIYDIYIIPHVGKDGMEWIRKIYGEKLNYLGPFENPVEAKNAIASMDIFIGSRMHATIGAFSAGVSTIPVAYSRKFSGLFNHLRYMHVVDLLELETQQAIDHTINSILHYDKLKDDVNSSLYIVKEESKKNRKAYRELLIKEKKKAI